MASKVEPRTHTKCRERRSGKRCGALEPVLEHCELSCSSTHVGGPSAQPMDTQKPKLRILSKLRDGYVKLMNDMASGADLSGASSFFGATHDQHRASSVVTMKPASVA